MTNTPRLRLNKPDRTDHAKIVVINETFDRIDAGVQLKNEVKTLNITTSDWVEYSSPNNDYKKKKAVSVEGLTADDIVYLNYDLSCKTAAQDANASHVESEAGQIVIYAESVPSKALTAQLVIQKS